MITIYSHPGKPLIVHLEQVSNSCQKLISGMSWSENYHIPKIVIEKITYLCGAFHDIGKATNNFQRYLLSDGKDIIGPKNHALISSLFVREVVKRYLQTTTLTEFDKKLLCNFTYTSVRRHHGNLSNTEDDSLLESKSTELNEISESFYITQTQQIVNHFLSSFGITYDFNDFIEIIRSGEYINEIFDFYDDEIKFGDYKEISLTNKVIYFYIHQIIYGTLLRSDKTDVIVGTTLDNTRYLTENKVEDFRKKKGFEIPKCSLDEYKNLAYTDTVQNLLKLYDTRQHIYSITLPTGLGKTITSFGVALKLLGINPTLNRIIISIPFTSIIDQNFEVYQEIIQSDDSNILLKHHHQAEPAYKLKSEELSPDVSQFLIETWQSEVVVTTFVQLLDSIFSNDKGKLMKLTSMANSIIILDEIQTVNFKYWQLINTVFKELGELLNCYFILMSATQPLIFEPKNEIVELVPNYVSYFKYFNRTRIINKAVFPVSLVDFVSEVSQYIEENKAKDVLIIQNTKRSCLSVFNSLKMLLDSEECDIYYMSTSLTPFERKRIIGIIKNKPTNKQMIIVTTQLIEAGVDISVDTVFRELAPIDAIIQAAGRANRYNEKNEVSNVFIYEIADNIKGSGKVYGSELLTKTKNVLKGIECIDENNYLQLIESYFTEVKIQSDSRKDVFLDRISNLAFKDLGEFSLIDERNTESIFVQLSVPARDIWEEYIRIYSNLDLSIFEKRLAFSKIKSKFYDFVVNVPIPFGEKEIAFDSEKEFGFRLVKYGITSDFYHYSDSDFLNNIGYQETTSIFN